jgi:hypothetical protein
MATRFFLSILSILVALTTSGCGKGAEANRSSTEAGSKTIHSTSGNARTLSTLMSSAAAFSAIDWKSNQESDRIEVSNGWLIWGSQRGQIDKFSSADANCWGFETTPSTSIRQPDAKARYLICEAVRDAQVEGYFSDGQPTQYQLRKGDWFAYSYGGPDVYSPTLYRVKNL